MQASAAVTREALADESGTDERPLRLVAQRSLEIADADVVVLLRQGQRADDPDGLVIDVAVGAHADRLWGRRLPIAGTLAGSVFSSGKAERVAQLQHRAGLADLLSGEVEVGPMLAVPLHGSGRVHGVLCIARMLGRAAFTVEDLDMACGFANHAALAIELANARAEQQRLALLDDRERIAADLHDHVIQRLFAAGLSLQAMAAPLGRGPMADRLMAVIQSLDDTIRQIRSSIFQLQQEPGAVGTGVRARMLAVIADVTPALGFEPGVRFSGVLEGVLADDLVEELLAVLREALTNVARHAGAHAVESSVAASAGRLTVEVTDDGHGMGTTTRSSGLTNLRRRAEERGGTFAVEPRLPSGTRLTWTVPLAGVH
jgi:signal transduction histidine kinase